MNLTPPPGTPVVKRSRAKPTTTAAPTVVPESKKPTLTTKTARSRKKTATEPVAATPVVETTVSYTSDQLRSMIAMAAYYRAESRHFAPGNDMEDWLVAEQQVIANLT